MAFATFSDDMRTGNDFIDDQHASLFEIVNRLHEAMRSNQSRQVQSEILSFLNRYTVEHFQAEEALMKENSYPGLIYHKALHDDLAQQLKELEGSYEQGSMTLSIMTLHFLKDWLNDHILGADFKFASFMKKP